MCDSRDIAPDPDRSGLDDSGERCLPWIEDTQVVYEHLHRYHFAASLVAGMDVLDLGCGEGYGAMIMAGTASSVTAVDIDPSVVEHARSSYVAGNVRFEVGSALELREHPADSFDAVVCFEVLEHLREHDVLIEGIRNVLRPDGLLVLSTPDRESYNASRPPNPFHVRELSSEELHELLRGTFAHVATFTQHLVVGSVLVSAEPGSAVDVISAARHDGGWELTERADDYQVAIASARALPELPALSLFDDQEASLVADTVSLAVQRTDARWAPIAEDLAQRVAAFEGVGRERPVAPDPNAAVAAYEHTLLVPEDFYDSRTSYVLQAPTDVLPHVRFRGVDDDFWVWLHTRGMERHAGLRSCLPGVADDSIQQRVSGVTGEPAIRDGFVVYRLVREALRAHGGNLDTATILDFGVGWGRVLRFFLRDVPGEQLVGVDAHEPLVRLCRELNPWCRFEHVDKEPPLPFPDASFDLVFAYSLFSHFSETAHLAWIEELTRVLRPSGTIVVTTWGRDLITRCAELRGRSELQWHEQHLATLFDPTSDWLAEYDAGRYCFASHDVYGTSAPHFGEAAVPEEYVRMHWPRALEVTHYIDDRAVCQQAVVVAKRR
jgi:2-polyprenyl-3-methyl-5-hydroxy-6-metoxy-1,4-benzoquinol methylase